MSEYIVIWTIELNAKGPKAAAERALAIQRDPQSLATVFEVFNTKGKRKLIDLAPLEDLRKAILEAIDVE